MTATEEHQQQVIYVERAGNGMAVAALVLGILAMLFGLIPLFAFVAFPMAVLAVIFGAVGRKRGKERGKGKGMATAGLITGLCGFALAIIGVVVMNDAVNELNEDLNEIDAEFQRDMDELDRQLEEDLAEFEG